MKLIGIHKTRILIVIGMLTSVAIALMSTGCSSTESTALGTAPQDLSKTASSSVSKEDTPSSTFSSSSVSDDLSNAQSKTQEESIESQKQESVEAVSNSKINEEDSEVENRSLDSFLALSQYPELPNGCEVTSLAAVLNYYGLDVDKTTLSDTYLPKAPVGQANFYECFVGDPRDDDAFGCYAPVIVQTANSYLSSVGSEKRAVDITGALLSDVFRYIDQGIPVIIWATQNMNESYYSITWNVNGQDFTWRTPEHCMVLVGYDKRDNTVRVADPMVGGIVSYDMSIFEMRFDELYRQAVVIN